MGRVIDDIIASGPSAPQDLENQPVPVSKRIGRQIQGKLIRPPPLTSAERSRRYRAKHPYGPKRSDYRSRFGTYEMTPHCESFESDNCTGEEGQLLPHHVYYLSCPDCRGDESDDRQGDGRRGHCKDPEHLLTVCIPCHRTIHRNSPRAGQEHHYQTDYRLVKEIDLMNAHMVELGQAAD